VCESCVWHTFDNKRRYDDDDDDDDDDADETNGSIDTQLGACNYLYAFRFLIQAADQPNSNDSSDIHILQRNM